jgi:hypothetical protein
MGLLPPMLYCLYLWTSESRFLSEVKFATIKDKLDKMIEK